MFIMSGLLRENIVKMKQKRSDTSGGEVLKRVEGDILIPASVARGEEGCCCAGRYRPAQAGRIRPEFPAH